MGDTFTYSYLTLSIFYPAPYSLLSSISSLASGTMHWQILHMYRSLLWYRCSISFFLSITCLYPSHSLSPSSTVILISTINKSHFHV